jgi:ribosomal protein L12E/L44/L45/RPP1/RPP2
MRSEDEVCDARVTVLGVTAAQKKLEEEKEEEEEEEEKEKGGLGMGNEAW